MVVVVEVEVVAAAPPRRRDGGQPDHRHALIALLAGALCLRRPALPI